MLSPLAIENFNAAVERVDRLGLKDDQARAHLVGYLLLENGRQGRNKQEIRGDIDIPADKLSVTVQQETVHSGLTAALRAWRKEAADGKPAYTVIHDKTLLAIAEIKPTTLLQLERIRGLGPHKTKTFGPDILNIVAEHSGGGGEADQQPEPAINRMQQRADAIMAAIRKKPQTHEQLLPLADDNEAALLLILRQATKNGRITQDASGRYRKAKG